MLVHKLLPLVKAAPGGRIVHLGSLRGDKSYTRLQKYGQSKLAIILFSLQLAKLLRGSNASSNSLHTGLVHTDITRSYPGWFQAVYDKVAPYIAKTTAQGAATQVYVATHPDVAGISGAYFEDCNPVIVSGDSYLHEEKLAEKLWQVSLEMTEGFL